DLKLDTLDRNTYQQLKAGKQGIDGDEGGHLIASILNGSGEKINLLPMNSNLNRGLWKKHESRWANALRDGKTVKVKIEPVYQGKDIRPIKFKISYSIDNGRFMQTNLLNQAGG
ncbi:DNA/RNA non-specific endonuclease, partial [Frischella perrara]